jgi:hypothetical protein
MSETRLFTVFLVVFLVVFLAAIAFAYDSIPGADPDVYFALADRRTLFGIPCTFDVVSNLGFLIVGVYGLYSSRRDFFKLWISVSIGLTAFGSAYFHLEPNLDRVFWDRVPMILVFSGVIGWVIGDKFNTRMGRTSVGLTTLYGLATLVLARLGQLDLRPYFVLQYGGFLTILFLNVISRGRVSRGKIFLAMSLYALAKVFELLDRPIFEALQGVSGHTLKHLTAAIAIAVILKPSANPIGIKDEEMNQEHAKRQVGE